MKNYARPIGIIVTVGFLLLIPYAAMKLGAEGVNWTALDFTVAAILLLGAGTAIEIAMRVLRASRTRVVAVLAILFGLVMVWGALVRMGG